MGTKGFFFVVIAMVSMAAGSRAAIIYPRTKPNVIDNGFRHDKIPLNETLQALKLPSAEALRLVSAQGLSGYHNLVHLAFSPRQSIAVHWRSLMFLSRLGGKYSVPQLNRAARSHLWYMRNAALIGLLRVSHSRAVYWGRKLIRDPSLIVRTSAVETLRKTNDIASRKLLWHELYSRKNFHLGHSLWIRHCIVQALAAMAEKRDEPKLVAVLNDRDLSLYPPAIQGLERLTGRHFSAATLSGQRREWQAWWRRSQKL